MPGGFCYHGRRAQFFENIHRRHPARRDAPLTRQPRPHRRGKKTIVPQGARGNADRGAHPDSFQRRNAEAQAGHPSHADAQTGNPHAPRRKRLRAPSRRRPAGRRHGETVAHAHAALDYLPACRPTRPRPRFTRRNPPSRRNKAEDCHRERQPPAPRPSPRPRRSRAAGGLGRSRSITITSRAP